MSTTAQLDGPVVAEPGPAPAVGRVALVAGAAGGIGAAVTRHLAATGHDLILVDRDRSALERTVGELDGVLAAPPVDAADPDQIEATIATLSVRPDILVVAVGGDVRPTRLIDLSTVDFHAALNENLLAAVTLLRLCAPTMIERRWGRIVMIASVAGRSYSHFSNAAYVAAKAGLIGLTKQAAYELAPHGIAVNAVAPGPIDTPRVRAAWEAKPEPDRRRILERIPAGRMGTVDEVAATVVHLCSEAAGYTIGAVVDINGGLHI